MFRVLHLHPVHSDFQTTRSLDLLRKYLGQEIPMTSLSIGPGGDFGNLPEALLRLRFAQLERDQIVHAWGAAELFAATAAGFSRIVFSPQAKIQPKWWPWIKRLIRRRPIEVVCPSSWARDFFIAHGVPTTRCRILLPAIESGRLNGCDPELRARLGLADSDIVLLAPGESVREAGHGASLWAAAILSVLDPKWRLLIWGRGPMIDSLERFSRSANLNGVLIQAEKQLGEPIDFERIVSAADAALVFSEPASPVLPMGVCMAAGLPIVASETSELDEFLTEGVTALIEPSASPRRLAQRALILSNDSALKEKIVQNAKTKAAERFAATRFISDWRTVYTSLA
jgi:glycosyltransferase involved in cell wall biosynthesis